MSTIPPIPDEDHDFTPELARKIIALYQQHIAALEAQLEQVTKKLNLAIAERDFWREADANSQKQLFECKQSLEAAPPPRELTPAECDMIEGAFLRGVKRSLTNPPAPKVTEEEIETRAIAAANACGVTPYSDMRPFVIQAVKYALTAAQGAGKP